MKVFGQTFWIECLPQSKINEDRHAFSGPLTLKIYLLIIVMLGCHQRNRMFFLRAKAENGPKFYPHESTQDDLMILYAKYDKQQEAFQ